MRLNAAMKLAWRSSMKKSEIAQVKTYLDAIRGIPRFADLYAVDLARLEELDGDTNGWDWAEHDGAVVIEGLWLRASKLDDQTSLARICHLRAVAWNAALAEYNDTSPMSINRPTARSEASGLPCVVIDFDKKGNHRVYADPGAVVFSRTTDIPDDGLYRYSPPAIPDGWLDRPAGFLGDGSAAEQRAHAAMKAILTIESMSSDVN